MKFNSIPVLYYHRIGTPDNISVSIPVTEFERQMAFLSRKGYQAISLSRFYRWLCGREKIDFPAVCITFDDGFIDNLLYADPILKKYSFKAALFVATSLIRPPGVPAADKMVSFNEAQTRARLKDFSHFLSENELKKMGASGTWEIFSHTHFHNQVFTDTVVTGMYPQDDSHWGILSAYPDLPKKKNLPVYRRNAGLIQPGFRPVFSDDSVELLCETEEEYRIRVKNDLTVSLERISRMFPDQPALLCWPWGKTSDYLESEAVACGYCGAFLTSSGANFQGMNPMHIKRFPVKKAGLLRFSIGLLLRQNRFLAGAYSLLRNV